MCQDSLGSGDVYRLRCNALRAPRAVEYRLPPCRVAVIKTNKNLLLFQMKFGVKYENITSAGPVREINLLRD